MTSGGAFPPAARAAVLAATEGRCAGCGSPGPLEVNHRAARRMGGTSRASLGDPYNGVALCGPGGCHSWCEAHPDAARDLGWRLSYPNPSAPYWTAQWGWRAWVHYDGCWLHAAATQPAGGAAAVRLLKERLNA